MATAADIEGEPLVVVVHRRVKPGQERSFEAAMGEFISHQLRHRQQGVPGTRQAFDASARHRWRKIVRNGHGRRDALPASNVTASVIPDSGHWIMEENPTATSKIVRDFLVSKT